MYLYIFIRTHHHAWCPWKGRRRAKHATWWYDPHILCITCATISDTPKTNYKDFINIDEYIKYFFLPRDLFWNDFSYAFVDFPISKPQRLKGVLRNIYFRQHAKLTQPRVNVCALEEKGVRVVQQQAIGVLAFLAGVAQRCTGSSTPPDHRNRLRP